MKVAPERLVRRAVDRGFLHDGLMIGEDGGAIGWIREIVLDCADPWRLARFWAGLLGGTPVEWYPGWVTLEPPPHGQRIHQATGWLLWSVYPDSGLAVTSPGFDEHTCRWAQAGNAPFRR